MNKKLWIALVAFGILPLASLGQPGTAQTSAASIGVPPGMVAFFQGLSCPNGWRSAPGTWEGRYLVMSIAGHSAGNTVGNALTHGENRPTGQHAHDIQTAFYGGSCSSNCASWGGSRGINRAPRTTTSTRPRPEDGGMTISEGTNAPYVALRACIKA